MRYILDFTRAKMPEWWKPHWPMKIELVKGQHQMDYDLAPGTLPLEVEQEMVCFIQNSRPGVIWLPSAPIGFSTSNLPKGATIKEVRP